MEHNSVIHSKAYDSEIEYLIFDGNQLIDTEIYGNLYTKLECKLVATSVGAIFGSRKNMREDRFDLIYSGAYGYICDFYNLRLDYKFGTNGVLFEMSKELRKITYIYTGNSVYSDISVQSQFTTPYTLSIGGMNHIPSFNGRLYYLKLWQEDTLVRDFIPVRKGSIGYLYDKVSKKLFGNKGTGNFILGPDVANPIPNIRRVFRFGNKRYITVSNN